MNRKSGTFGKYKGPMPLGKPEGLHLSSSSRRHVEFNESESKKRKVRFFEEETMESGKVEAGLKPLDTKRKRMTGHSFKARLKAILHTKDIVAGKSPVSQLEKIPSYEETKEQVQSINAKKQCLKLKVASSRDSCNTIGSGRDKLMTEACVNKQKSKVDEEMLRPSSLKFKIVRKNIGKDSAKGKHNEKQILSKQKQAMKDKVAGNQVEKNSARKEHCEIFSQKKQAVKEKRAGSEIEKNYAKEEHLENHAVLQKKRALKDKGAGDEIEKDSSRVENYGNKILSEKKQVAEDKCDGNEVEKDSAMQEHYENQILPEKKQAMKKYYAGDVIEKDSAAKEKHYENQIVSEQKFLVKNKDARSEIDSLINKIQQKCDNRLKKLNKKQQEKIQEFHRIWTKERSQLEKNHKLELATIRYIYHEDTARRVYKLKLLDDKFAKEMEEHDVLKDKKLKALKHEQLASWNKEKQKGDRWLAEAKACCSKQLGADYDQNSIGLQSEEVDEVSQSSTQHVGLLKMHTVEDKNPSESVQGSSGKSASTVPQNEIQVTFSQGSVLAGVEQLNQPKEIDSYEIVCGLPFSKECGPCEIRPIEHNNEVPPEVTEGVPDDIDYANPVELSDDSSNTGFNEGDGTGLPAALLNQRERTDETTISGLPLVGQRSEPVNVPNEIQPVELNKEIPPQVPENVHNGSVDCANPVGLTNYSSDKRIDDEDACLLHASVNQQDETDEIIGGGLPLVEQILEHSDHQASEDQIHQGSTCDVIRNQDAEVEKQQISPLEVHASEDGDNVTSEESIVKVQQMATVVVDQVASHIEVQNLKSVDDVNPFKDRSAQVVENQNSSFEVQDQPVPDTSCVEVTTLDIIDIATPEKSHEKLQHRDAPVVEQIALQIGVENSKLVDTVNPVQSNDILRLENCEGLRIGSSDVSPSCNQPTSSEVGSHRKSTHIAQIEGTEVVLQQSASLSRGNQEIQSNHLDIRSDSQVSHETNVETSASYSNNVAMSQTLASTVEFSHEVGLQPGSLAHLYGSSYGFSDPNQWKFPYVFDAPLHDELERIRKETEQLQKSHEDMIVQLRSDREKEIQEINAQINRKYELKLQNAEAEFSLKKNGLDKNRDKVIQNKLLSAVVASTCLGFWSFGLPKVRKVNLHGSMQQHQPLPLQHLVTPDPRHSACQPAPSPATASPDWQSVQHLSLPRCTPVTSQNFRPSQQTVHHALPLPFGSTSPPPIIGAITPIGGDPHFSGGNRYVLPHLQPTPTGSGPRFAGETRCLPFQLAPVGPRPTSSTPAASFSPVAPHLLQSTSQNRPQLQGGPPAMLSPSLSPLDLPVNVGDWAHLPSNLTFGSLQQSYRAGQRLRNVQGNRDAFSGLPTHTICLLDED